MTGLLLLLQLWYAATHAPTVAAAPACPAAAACQLPRRRRCAKNRLSHDLLPLVLVAVLVFDT
jgi:hypothetical protein